MCHRLGRREAAEGELLDRQISRKERVMRRTLFGRLAVVLTVIGLFAAMAMPASAGKPEKITINEAFDEEQCGIPVHTTIQGTVILHIQDYVIEPTTPEANSFWIGILQVHLDIAWTNAAGVSVTDSFRHTTNDGDLVYIGEGNWLYTWAASGHPDIVRVGTEILLREVGRISVAEVIHFGDLSTTADDYFVSGEVISVAGPHPLNDPDRDVFCEIFTEIMG
jgi:hypothetical protein